MKQPVFHEKYPWVFFLWLMLFLYKFNSMFVPVCMFYPPNNGPTLGKFIQFVFLLNRMIQNDVIIYVGGFLQYLFDVYPRVAWRQTWKTGKGIMIGSWLSWCIFMIAGYLAYFFCMGPRCPKKWPHMTVPPPRYHLSYHGRALAFSSTTLQLLCGSKLAG